MHRLTVIGAGYLGAVHATCLAELGFEVLGMDIDPVLVATLNQGQAPFCEPGLDPMLRRGLRSGRLRFTVSLPEAARFGDVHFLCVGTPQRNGHPGADLSQLYACVDALAPLLRRPCLVAGKSTTPVGTAATLADRLAALARPARKLNSPGILSSCARVTPWPTPCARPGSWPACALLTPRNCCAMSTAS